ncbi:M12 family metallopeptidase [Epilithonimonas zeae]|uniref:M12 family metallopeptidase n=1 Tax=Epilithonimonas zeae TaxID=1416779 RepID=UPI00200D394A|nr:M12 family metallopeptidase [Epilithonimonas zeae]UQB68066.1 hypothetical protein KI430_13655 [Epilithonimonas zeae]
MNGNNLKIAVRDGRYFISDDIIISEEQFQFLKSLDGSNTAGKSNIFRDFARKWTDGVVPYEISSGFPNTARIISAINHFSSDTGVKLVPRTNQQDYIKFVRHASESSSYVGRVGGGQIINIADWANHGVVMHEIAHAVGVFHEHQRPDRDAYIWVDPSVHNDVNYQIKNFSEARTFGPMDFNSIMMYSSNSYMRLHSGEGWYSQREQFTTSDRIGLYYLYQPLTFSYGQLENVIEQNTNGSQDIYHVQLSSKVNFHRNSSLNSNPGISYDITVAAHFKQINPSNPNGSTYVEYYTFNSITGGTIYWESRTDTHQGYMQPGHNEVYLEKVIVSNPQ